MTFQESGNNSAAEAPANQSSSEILAEFAEGKIPGGEPAAEAAPEAEAKPVWNGEEWAFESNGKRVIPDSPDKLKTWISQGYNYSQRMGALNQEHQARLAAIQAKEQEYQRRLQEVEQRYKPYSEIDEYARSNKEWWDHVQQQWQSRETQGLDPNLAKVLTPLTEKIGKLEEFITSQREQAEQAALAARQQEEDQALDAEIESIRKEFPNIDLDATDEAGSTLLQRIYKHGADNGIRTFRAAFRDHLFPQLLNQQSAQSKVQATKTVQAQTKAGVLGRTQVPTKELSAPPKGVKWSDPSMSSAEILKEFRQIHGG